jgi:transposase
MPGTRKQLLVLRATDRARLMVLARSPSLPYRAVVQAKAVLYVADGIAMDEIARRCDTSTNSVRRWVRRFAEVGVDGIGRVSEGRGRPLEISPEQVRSIVEDTLGVPPPDGTTRWSSRAMAERHGVSKDYVLKVWRSQGIYPAGGRPGTATHNRHAGSSIEAIDSQILDANAIGLLAALNAATGDALSRCRPNSNYRDFLFFLKLIEAIELWVQHWNDDARPFSWHSQGDAIDKARRGKAALEHYIKSATRS